MNFKEFRLLHEWLSTDMRIGFELEAFGLKEPPCKETVAQLEKQFLPVTGKFVEDASIKGFNEVLKEAFEYTSGIIPVSPLNLQGIIKFLSALSSHQIATNPSCGFHVHVSYPNVSREENAWVLFNIAHDYKNFEAKFIKHKHAKDLKESGIFSSAQFASATFLKEIGVLMKKPEQHDMIELAGILDDSKYRVLRNHPQGTIEWRGPRDFLNYGNVDSIKGFIRLLFEFLLYINNAIERQVVNDVKKSVFIATMANYRHVNIISKDHLPKSGNKLSTLKKKTTT